MKKETNGWIVINIGHPTTGSKYIVTSTFAYKRREAIKSFIEGSGSSWEYWSKEYNFRCVRATQLVTIDDQTI